MDHQHQAKSTQKSVQKPSQNTNETAGQPSNYDNLVSQDLSPATMLQLQRIIGNRQLNRMLLQREDMPPMNVTGDKGGKIEDSISGLENLTTPRPTGDITLTHGDEAIANNAPDPGQKLPYTDAGWDAHTIMNNLGQYDKISGTDSDGSRCVQAVAMASYIPGGPDAVASYLGSITFDGLLSRDIKPRQQTAMKVIKLVKSRLQAKQATYGDLSWAQEAIHDFFYSDTVGSPIEDAQKQITPTLEAMNRVATTENIWCNSPADVMAQANALPPGGQLIVNEWTVVFNQAYDQVEEQGYETRDRMQVQINGQMKWIRRIKANTRPKPQDIHEPSDKKSGHQLLIIRDNTPDGPLRLYEPEITDSGKHLVTLSSSGQELAKYLKEETTYGIYGYIQITGKILPQQHTTSAFGEAN